MTTTYQGPAMLVAPGLVLPVVADLRVEWQTFGAVMDHGHVVRERGLKEWKGSIQSDAGSLWEVLNSTATLRLPDGREGKFFTYLSGCSLNEGRVEIQGSGPAPFWDEADEPTS